MTHTLTIAIFASILTLTGCQNLQNEYPNQSTQPKDELITDVQKPDLVNYAWQLVEATYSNNKPVYRLNSIKDQVSMSFDNYGERYTVGFGVGCNSSGGHYTLIANVLSINDIMSTEMFCQELDSAERLLKDEMQGSSKLIYQTASAPILTQKTDDGMTLVWRGKITAEAQYQQIGETVFWKIDHERPICPDGTTNKCLNIKPIYYNDNGIMTGEGEWMLITQSPKGYIHHSNQDQVIRLKRYVTNPSDVKGKQFVYEFDMIIESAEIN